MVFKINISDKGKTYKVELDSEELVGKKIGENVAGNIVAPLLNGYELQITGPSDKAGFAGHPNVQGSILKKLLLTKGKFLKRVPHKGFRRKKTVRGNEISLATVQVNMKVIKQGGKKLEEVFTKSEPKSE